MNRTMFLAATMGLIILTMIISYIGIMLNMDDETILIIATIIVHPLIFVMGYYRTINIFQYKSNKKALGLISGVLIVVPYISFLTYLVLAITPTNYKKKKEGSVLYDPSVI